MSEVKKWYSCNVEMQYLQKVPFRIKGTPGIWKLVFGELAELDEEMLYFDVYICPECGEIRLFADEKAKAVLERITPYGFLKKCVKCGKDIPVAYEECQYCGANQLRKKAKSVEL